MRATPAAANAALGLLSKMFKMVEAWGLLPSGENPCRGFRRYRTRKRERFLTQDEFRRLGRALSDLEAEGKAWPVAAAAIRLLALTGCRRSEILDLRWDNVDHTAGELRLHGLRHSFASRALALGEGLSTIGKLLDHARIETTSRYAHLARESVRESAGRVAASIAQVLL